MLAHLQGLLVSINAFGYRDPVDITITRYDSEIANLKKELAQKEKLIQKMKAFETDQKIRITKGYLYTLVDLIQQLPELKLTEDPGMRLLRPSTEMIWVKMICKYFQHGDEEISSQTLRSYFPANKDDPGIKYRTIQEKYKLYRIMKRL